jgi:7-cyano-7-deazaguanine synthase in queuosine biosynthesis
MRDFSTKQIIKRGGMAKLFKYRKNKDIRFVFWTGGYDSTFRLLQLLIIFRRPVVAVYISDPTTDSRQNTRYELRQMRLILKKVKQRFPFTQDLIRDFVVIKEVPQRTRHLDKTFRELEKKYREFYKRYQDGRVYYGQMEKLAIVSKRMRRVFDLGVIRNERDREVYRNDYLMRYQTERCTFSSKMPYLYRAFCWLRFPIAHITKEEMLLIGHQHYFSDILLFDTLSCRWPKGTGYIPCKKCHMCKFRKRCFEALGRILTIPFESQKPRYKKYFEINHIPQLNTETLGKEVEKAPRKIIKCLHLPDLEHFEFNGYERDIATLQAMLSNHLKLFKSKRSHRKAKSTRMDRKRKENSSKLSKNSEKISKKSKPKY